MSQRIPPIQKRDPQTRDHENVETSLSMAPPPLQLSASKDTVPAFNQNPPPFQLKQHAGQENQSAPFQLKEEGQEGPATQAPGPFVPGLSGGDSGGAGGADSSESAVTAVEDYSSITVDFAKGKAIDLAWDYWDQLKEQYSLTDHLAELLERAAMYLIDCGVRVTGISKYLMAMNPYLEILKAVKTVIETIPPAIRTFIGYAIGYGLKKFSDKNMWGAIEEKHLNFLLMEGGDIMASIGTLIDFLYDLGHNPVQTIYRGIWAAVRYFTGNDEIDSMTDYLNHLEDKAKNKSGYSRSGRNFESNEEGAKENAGPQLTGEEKAQQDNLLRADLGFFWLRMGQPKLDRWNDEESGEERGGLVVNSGMGVKVFGQAMGTDDIDIKVPYSGDWEATFNDLVLLSDPISLGNWFRGGPVNMPYLKIKSGVGVDRMKLQLLDFAFGQDVFVAKELAMTYSAGDGLLGFSGDTILNVFGHQIFGKFNLDIGTDGDFKGGYVDVILPEELEIIQNRLSLGNLNFIGKWGEDGLELLELAGDIHANLSDKLDFDATRTALRWENGEFMGLVDKMSVLVPLGPDTFVELTLDDGKISGDGFEADKVMLKFFFGDDQTNEEHTQRLKENREKGAKDIQKEDLEGIIPGFNMQWIKNAGLETLVVSASASGIQLNSDGLSIDGDLEKKLHKFAAEFLGVRAEFDGDKNEGSLKGNWNYRVPNLPALNFDFPIIPGINAGLGVSANLEVGAELDGHLRKLPQGDQENIHPWELGGYAGLFGDANVQAHFDVSAGHPLLVSIHAGMFAEAGANLAADAAMHGTLNWDEDAHRISLSDKQEEKPSAAFDMHADLHATLGAHIKAKAFHIFQVTLWEYRFLNWEMGIWRAKGRMVANEEGGYDFEFEQAGFDGGRPGRRPEIEFKVAKTEDVIREREREDNEIDDPLLMWRLVHDVTDPTQPMDNATRRVLLEKLKRLNDTGDSIASFMGSAEDSFEDRVNPEEESYSYLMTRDEFEEYSTVKGWFGIKDRKKDIKKIDRYLDKYHKEKNPETKKAILIHMIDVLLPEYLHDGGNRESMVAKLLHDAKRELRRLRAQEEKSREASASAAGAALP